MLRLITAKYSLYFFYFLLDKDIIILYNTGMENKTVAMTPFTTKNQLYQAQMNKDVESINDDNMEKTVNAELKEAGSLESSQKIERLANRLTRNNMLKTARIINNSLKELQGVKLSAKDIKDLAVSQAIFYDKVQDFKEKKLGKHEQKTKEQLEYMKNNLMEQIKNKVVKAVIKQTEKTIEITGDK